MDLTEIAVIGRSCRLPGAPNTSALWTLLTNSACAITSIPEERWAHARFGHPRRFEPGRSYTWAAGVLDDIWGFDAGAFGISPREAEQMDPQQRLLLELVWEALEDAEVPPSSLSGGQVGVYVGASSLDYGNRGSFDLPAGSGHFATGNTLSLISNRVSYVFDLRGPSLTIDTACSSSSVALHDAVSAIRSKQIDIAIVGGVNILASPFGFISFSQAAMLSPTGQCRPFDAKADGYVRAEGGVVLVLRACKAAVAARNPIHGLIVGSGVNSDGRTTGVSMPSPQAQADLLTAVYRSAGIEPDSIAFVEAHGTGTAVGDPAEAKAIGNALGRRRTSPLPIGSIKSNIGHPEPAAGLAGTLKAMLALEHGLLPPSLNCDALNPAIDFEALNVAVCRAALPLPNGPQRRYAGINSFGFGGTNAHIVVAQAPRPPPAQSRTNGGADFLLISAQGADALSALARQYAAKFETMTAERAHPLRHAATHRREHLPDRLAVTVSSTGDTVKALRRFAEGDGSPAEVVHGAAVSRKAPVAFVYSGNGSQWAGMGRSAYLENETFRARFDEIDRKFQPLAGWSLKAAIFDEAVAERLALTSVAQPLIFAIQNAATQALFALGLRPSAVLGHSVGEVAAALAAGVFDLDEALRVIHFRSRHQELARKQGRMAVLAADVAVSQNVVGSIPGLEIAAFNSPQATTLAGPGDAINKLVTFAEQEGLLLHALDLDYPFHSSLMDVVREPLLRDLGGLKPKPASIPFVSTVTGAQIAGGELAGEYWWKNVRQPVQFVAAVKAATDLGARVLIEIGPRSILGSHLNNTLDSAGVSFAVLGVLDRNIEEGDPFHRAVGAAWVRGANVDLEKIAGPDPGPQPDLPRRSWQRQHLRLERTVEALSVFDAKPAHPLLGTRIFGDGVEWRGLIDPVLLPMLSDHRVNGQMVCPGAAFVEMALAAAREWRGLQSASVLDLDLLQPMMFADAASREVMTRISPATGTIEISSRPRLSQVSWQLHAIGKIAKDAQDIEVPACEQRMPGTSVPANAVYAIAAEVGLEFGPSFQQLESVLAFDSAKAVVNLLPPTSDSRFGLDPARLDSCFHGLIVFFNERSIRRTAYLPVRFGDIRLLQPGIAPARALIELLDINERSIRAHLFLLDQQGQLIAALKDARFQASRVKRTADLAPDMLVETKRAAASPYGGVSGVAISADELMQSARAFASSEAEGMSSQGTPLLDGWATAAAAALVSELADDDRQLDLDALVASGRWPGSARPWLACVLRWLAMSDLAVAGPAGWKVETDASLPDDAIVLRTFAVEHPDRSAELLLASHVSRTIDRGRKDAHALANFAIPATAADSYEFDSRWAVRFANYLANFLRELKPLWPEGRSLRILQVGYGPLAHAMMMLARERQARLTVLEHDPRRLELAKLSLAADGSIEVRDHASSLPQDGFDVILAAGSIHRWPSPEALLSELGKALGPGGVLLAGEPARSLFSDLVFGLEAGWFGADGGGDLAGGRLKSASAWRAGLERAGFVEHQVQSMRFDSEDAVVLAAKKAATSSIPSDERRLSVLCVGNAPDLADRMTAAIAEKGHDIAFQRTPAGTIDPEHPPDHVTYVGEAARHDSSPVDRLRDQCLGLRDCVTSLEKIKTSLWIVTLDAHGDDVDAVGAGYWAFARTVANESPNLRVRRVDVSTALPPDATAARIADCVLCSGDESELVLGKGTQVLRFERLDRIDGAHAKPSPACRLERGAQGGLDNLAWTDFQPVQPGPGMIEIEVEATGLNFRDVMATLGVLTDDVLEGGFAGSQLGLECCGLVSRIGAGVKGMAPGDRVIAFASAAFATHVIVPAEFAVPAPMHLSSEAAATIPVCFSTAYYAIVTLAQIKPEEWILVHGAAGGVGLAAVQIAQWRGARVIATAGSQEKRDLLTVMGVEHVLDSRSLRFVDDARSICPAGLDVVLNSLSGEAMERGVGVLKPFGRFLELGKRDYVANTHIGLRAFRNNLTYFGIDLDQLLQSRPEVGVRVFREVVALIEQLQLQPLPYRRFPAGDVKPAFRLMQQAGHVGKIVVAAPAIGTAGGQAASRFPVHADRSYLITGGFSGFGLETARWLAQRGARHLVLLGRRGPRTPDAGALLDELKRSGVDVMAESCDVAEFDALRLVFERMDATLPPLAGVIHSAMVLEDSTLANLTAAQMEGVLRPKVLGAEHLDRLTRNRRLDFFILFSSATTFVGNPGQGSYVAANGYVEGLARRRRQRGLPAVAVAWGAIGDAGVLAKTRATYEALSNRIGVKAMPARAALDAMADVLARSDVTERSAVIAIAQMDWSAARARLRVLDSPTYGALPGAHESHEPAAEMLDVRQSIETQGIEQAAKIVQTIIIEEVARVLRMSKESISVNRPLAEIGLDSLMAVELAISLQDRLGEVPPLSTMAGSLTVAEVAKQVLAVAKPASRH